MPPRKPQPASRAVDAAIAGGAKPAALRHAAITRTLPSYSTYKRWSDRMKSAWEGSEEPNR
jgi:hypothetical protein